MLSWKAAEFREIFYRSLTYDRVEREEKELSGVRSDFLA